MRQPRAPVPRHGPRRSRECDGNPRHDEREQRPRRLAARTGLHIRQRDREHFLSTLAARLRNLKLASSSDYRRLLESNTEAAALEWRRLIALLTNGESYFFRDKGQMTLLKERILP